MTRRGCAALILSAMVLSHYEVEALIILTDEEEGVVGVGNRAFSRGSAPAAQPDSSGPTARSDYDFRPARGGQRSGLRVIWIRPALVRAVFLPVFSSAARGGVTPPQLLTFSARAGPIFSPPKELNCRKNSGYVSRSDCVSAMLATPNVALVGYPGAYSHFNRYPPGLISLIWSIWPKS